MVRTKGQNGGQYFTTDTQRITGTRDYDIKNRPGDFEVRNRL